MDGSERAKRRDERRAGEQIEEREGNEDGERKSAKRMQRESDEEMMEIKRNREGEKVRRRKE